MTHSKGIAARSVVKYVVTPISQLDGMNTRTSHRTRSSLETLVFLSVGSRLTPSRGQVSFGANACRPIQPASLRYRR